MLGHLQAALLEHQSASLFRERYPIDKQLGMIFCSNDYLGLAQAPELKAALQDAVAKEGVGSGASQLVSGHHSAHADLEAAMAEFLNLPRVLVFSTGFMANLAVLTTLTGKHDLVIADKLNHASLIDGARFSEADMKRYQHANMSHCEQLLKLEARQKFLVSDGVFSMDGDVADIASLQTLAERYQANMIIDDAHGLGVLGKTGRGCYEYHDRQLREQDILTATFGKAFGGFGAFVAGSDIVIEHLIQFARSYIYTTAMPPAYARTMLLALRLIQEQDWRREQLQDRIAYFKQKAQARALPLKSSHTPIQPIMIGDAEKTNQVATNLRARGFFVTSIRPPTVPKAQSRLRITLNVHHTHQQIDALLDALVESLQ